MYVLWWHIFFFLYFKVLKCIFVMNSHLCLQIDKPKKLLILNATVCCVIFRILLFDMGMHECLEKMLTWTKVPTRYTNLFKSVWKLKVFQKMRMKGVNILPQIYFKMLGNWRCLQRCVSKVREFFHKFA